MELLETILAQMSTVKKAQRNFIISLLMNLMCVRGKANYSNLSRYGEYHEKTYRRWYNGDFDFVKFNHIALKPLTGRLIAVQDCSFSSKSGKHTYGLGKFYNSKQGKVEKGLEISTLAIVDVDYNTAYNLSTRQTCPDTAENRVQQYISHLEQDRQLIPESVRYLAIDGYYAKTKYIDGATNLDLQLIGKLRHDAHLRWLYQGEQKPLGRNKLYDGKVKFDNLNDFDFVDEVEDVKLYTAVVNSPRFKRNLRVVYLVKQLANKVRTALLFSTDINLAAKDIYQFYKARFQIEFLFRDAKQFLGLNDCQARSRKALHFHFNAVMTALNLIKLQHRSHYHHKPHVLSVSSWKTRYANIHLLQRFSSYLGFDLSSIKFEKGFDDICNFGVIDM